MSEERNAFGLLQKLGKAVMLPVSVLPVAGILLGVGSSQIPYVPPIVLELMAKAGGSVFASLPLLFAIGVALGLAGGDGVAALAATVGYGVMVATLGVMAHTLGRVPTHEELEPFKGQIASHFHILPDKVDIAITSATIDTGVFGGILVGMIAAVCFNRYYRIELPPYLGFFAGKRFVPIVTALGCLILGVVLSGLWPPVGAAIGAFSDWAVHSNTALAVFIYGFVERCLIPFGLHHIWNVPFYFEMGSYTLPDTGQVVHGDITRFMMGDPTAGILGGGYLFKMWGLPAAALAMWHCAKPERRTQVGGIMVSAALTAFLTGITEPIEFSFMFVSPPLYALHALLAGTAETVFYWCGGLLGTSFSHGLIDFLILGAKGTRIWLVPCLGLMYAAIYYGVFRFCILTFDIKTPGREPVDATDESRFEGGESDRSRRLVLAFGGRKNITSLDACITRLRVTVQDPILASPLELKALGASGVLVVGRSLQAIFGPQSENLKTAMELYLQTAGGDADLDEAEVTRRLALAVGEEKGSVEPTKASLGARSGDVKAWLEALGGRGNIKELRACAETRVRVAVQDPSLVSMERLFNAGVPAVMRPSESILHLVVGRNCHEDLKALKKEMTSFA